MRDEVICKHLMCSVKHKRIALSYSKHFILPRVAKAFGRFKKLVKYINFSSNAVCTQSHVSSADETSAILTGKLRAAMSHKAGAISSAVMLPLWYYCRVCVPRVIFLIHTLCVRVWGMLLTFVSKVSLQLQDACRTSS